MNPSTVTYLRADAEQRAEVWEGLLHGMAADPAFAVEAVGVLGLEGTSYVAVVVEDGGPIDLDGACRTSSWLQQHAGAVGIATLDHGGMAGVVARLSARADSPVGVSGPVDAGNLEGALAQAGCAVRTRVGVAGVTAFEEALPEALLQGSPEITAYLVSRWLGPLLELPSEERDELLDTLRGWVDAGCSATAAAALLYCHRNTVLNRLRRVSELLGRELASPPPLELVLALRAVAGLRSR